MLLILDYYTLIFIFSPYTNFQIGMKRMSNSIARIENKFIENARYKLGVRDQKVILYLIANTDPTQDNFIEQIVPVKELETILKKDGKKWGSFYEVMNDFCDNITDRKISFPSDVLVDGKPLKGYINWFQSVRPVQGDNGDISIRFLFSSDLKPFLLKLKEYARINRMEVAKMRSSYSIRLFQIFKAQRERQRKYRSVVTITYELKELKEILGLYDPKKKKYKYEQFREFKRNVIVPAEKEINEQTSIYIETYYERNRHRKITHLRFNIYDRSNNPALVAGERKKAILLKIRGDNTYSGIDLDLFKKTYPKDYKDIIYTVDKEINKFKKEAGRDSLHNEKTMRADHIKTSCLEHIRKEIELIQD